MALIETDLQNTLYWNTEKGYPFADRARLQLPDVILNTDNLSQADIKTASDLAQYQSESGKRFGLGNGGFEDTAQQYAQNRRPSEPQTLGSVDHSSRGNTRA